MHTKDNCGWLDRFRLIAALLVVAIHTSPLGSFSPEGDFFFTRVLARIAVPFFFMVTGQFVVRKFTDKNDLPSPEELSGKEASGGSKGNSAGQRQPWAYLKKILFLYAGAILLYLPVGIYAGHYKGLTPLSALRMLLFDGTFYHLWYFPACLLGVLTVYLMSRFLGLRGMLAVSGVLYVVGLLGDSYFGLAQKLPGAEGIYEFFFQICSYTRNGLFFAPLFLTLGAWCTKGSRRGLPVYLTAFLISFLLMTAEAFTLRSFSWQRHDSMYLLLVPVMISLYRTLLCLSQFSGTPRKRFRSASLWIYLLHPAFIIVVRGIAKILHLTPLLVDNSFVHYLAVSLLSVGAGFGMTFLPVNKVLAFFRQTAHDKQTLRRTDSSEKPLGLNTAVHSSKTARLKCSLSGKSSSSQHTPSSTGRAWIELDTSALAQNTEYLRSLLPEGCRLMPAVKANAYGHGAELIAGELNRLGVDAFCVACLSEGISLRRANIKGEILILGYTPPEDFPLLARYRLTQTVLDYAYAELLSQAGIMLHVHIGIDTGMHRIGIRCENREEILAVFEMKNLIIDGMFTHLCTCDSPLPEDEAFTESQIQAFYHVADILEEQGIPCPRLHLQSSYGLLNYPGLPADYVRAGIALYGVASTMEDSFLFRENLTPVLSLKARVASVRTLYAGDSAGYGLAFTAKKDMNIAVLSVGYADGLPRELSCGKGYVLLHGCKAPVIGRICMDQTLVDISGVPQTCAGDTAVLIGVSGEEEITAEELACQCGTITNELLSRLGGRLERIVWKGFE